MSMEITQYAIKILEIAIGTQSISYQVINKCNSHYYTPCASPNLYCNSQFPLHLDCNVLFIVTEFLRFRSISLPLFQTLMNHLWFGKSLEEAIAAPVVFVDSKNVLKFEPLFDKVIHCTHLVCVVMFDLFHFNNNVLNLQSLS